MIVRVLQSIFAGIPLDLKIQSRSAVTKLPYGNSVLAWYLRTSRRNVDLTKNDFFLISFPKCGRTWLRLLIGRFLVQHYGLSDLNPMALNHLAAKNPEIPRIGILHEDNPQWKSASQLNPDKTSFANKKVIFLVRDIRDVIVSLYFQKTRRDHEYHGPLSSFVKEPVGSVDTIIAYYNVWAKNCGVPKNFLLVRYEDMKTDTGNELTRVLNFLGYSDVSADMLAEVVEYASFQRMHKMEGEGKFRPFDMKPGDASDPESYKTRKGKVGGYRDYMSPEEISWLNERIGQNLSDFFHYQLS